MLLYLFLTVFVVTTFTDFCPFFYWGCGAFNVTSNEELLGYNFDKLSKFLPNTLPNNKSYVYLFCAYLYVAVVVFGAFNNIEKVCSVVV